MKISVIGGGGYVGLITSIGLVCLGHQVTGIDKDPLKIEKLKACKSPIHEAGVQEELRRCLETGRLTFERQGRDGLRQAEAIFIAVGSPAGLNGEADLGQIREVAQELGQGMGDYAVIAIKSTVPLGSVELLRTGIGDMRREGTDYDIVINPEFLREGQGLNDFFYPARIVIGTESMRAQDVMREVYRPLIDDNREDGLGGIPIIETTMANALMIKYAANGFLATRISFINEIAAICEQVGAEIGEVVKGLGYDPRIGRDYLQAGIGFGGPCLEKDVQALVHASRGHNVEPYLLDGVLKRNQEQVRQVIERLRECLGGDIKGKRVGVYGLAFKAGTGDVRTSLSLRVMEQLLGEGVEVTGHDPVAIEEARELIPGASYNEDPYEVARGADALLVLTGWPQYKELSYRHIKEQMKQAVVIDGRNLLNPQKMRTMGFRYHGIGQ